MVMFFFASEMGLFTVGFFWFLPCLRQPSKLIVSCRGEEFWALARKRGRWRFGPSAGRRQSRSWARTTGRKRSAPSITDGESSE
jgi:hypothetical protein